MKLELHKEVAALCVTPDSVINTIRNETRNCYCLVKPQKGFSFSVKQALAVSPPHWVDALLIAIEGRKRYQADARKRATRWLIKPENAEKQKKWRRAHRVTGYDKKWRRAHRNIGYDKKKYEHGKEVFARELGRQCVHCGESRWSKLVIMHKYGTQVNDVSPSSLYLNKEEYIIAELASGKYEMGCYACNSTLDMGKQWPIVDNNRYSEASRKNFTDWVRNRTPSLAQVKVSRNNDIVRKEYGIWCPIYGDEEGPQNRFVWSHLVSRVGNEKKISDFYNRKTDKEWKQEVFDKKCIWCSQKANSEYDSHWCRTLGKPQTEESRLKYAQWVWLDLFKKSGEGASCPWPRPNPIVLPLFLQFARQDVTV